VIDFCEKGFLHYDGTHLFAYPGKYFLLDDNSSGVPGQSAVSIFVNKMLFGI